MKHNSVLKLNSPIEFIESSKISPFISKVQIKVCYVGDEPNRNRSIITKEVAKEMAPSLRGCPIVGFYNEANQDYEGHNKQINISNGKWELTDSTVPYGFVDLNANIWFATYIDDEENEREYLCTEGYVWDHAFPEAKRIITKGNNQSMELDEDTCDAFWTRDDIGRPQFFIINEAFFSKLCILGEDNEPCFEGSQITKFSLVIDESFQQKMYSMMNEIKDLLAKGGTKNMFTTYAVEIGDALWSSLYRYIQAKFPNTEDECWGSKYSIDGVYEEGTQKFAILFDRNEQKYFRLNFSLSETEGFVTDDNLIEVTKTYQPVNAFSEQDVKTYALQFKKQEEKQGKTEQGNKNDSEEPSEGKKEKDEDDDDDKKKKAESKKFSYNSLDEIPEYISLQNKFSEASTKLENLQTTITSLQNELSSLREFKQEAEKKDKEAMIAKFYMLSDEDKADVVKNINTYSLDEIESKLSILCVRNKVSFAEEDTKTESSETTYSLTDTDDSSTPAWVKAALETEKTLH